jgi:hypothetical protein
MPNTTHVEAQKSQEVMNSQKKLIIVEDISNFKKQFVKFSPHLDFDFSLVAL